MLQDIRPHEYHCEYNKRVVKDDDYILIFDERQMLMDCRKDIIKIPLYKDIKLVYGNRLKTMIYLFSIDETAFFLADSRDMEQKDDYAYKDIEFFRTFKPSWLAFAGITGSQLYRWYLNHTYCGKCAGPMIHSQSERAMCCPHCKVTEYPKISPAVIVGIIDGDKILMSKYAGRTYKRYALIAGFMEIGETLEDTVHREVMEEVGVKVKNLRYYKSQPWSFSDSLLVGFFADLDGDGTITLDEDELSEAVWMQRSEIPESSSDISLTNEMIEWFRNQKE